MPDEAVEADSSSFLPLLLAAPPGFLRMPNAQYRFYEKGDSRRILQVFGAIRFPPSAGFLQKK
jgi:hypothetical protein